MFTAALFIINKRWKKPKCSLTDGWINKMWYVQNMSTMEYECNRILFILKRNEILTHAVPWMILENIMLSEISWLQKDKYCMTPLI